MDIRPKLSEVLSRVLQEFLNANTNFLTIEVVSLLMKERLMKFASNECHFRSILRLLISSCILPFIIFDYFLELDQKGVNHAL